MNLRDFVTHPGWAKLKEDLARLEAGAIEGVVTSARTMDEPDWKVRYNAGITEGIQRVIAHLQRFEKEGRKAP